MSEEFNLKNLLAPEHVIVLDRADKESILNSLIELLADSSLVKSKEELTKGVFAREELMSTGIGLNLGIPHVRLNSISDIAMAVALVREGVEGYESLDSLPVKLIFMIVAKTDQNTQHLRLLSQLSSSLKDSERRNSLLESPDAETLFQALVN